MEKATRGKTVEAPELKPGEFRMKAQRIFDEAMAGLDEREKKAVLEKIVRMMTAQVKEVVECKRRGNLEVRIRPVVRKALNKRLAEQSLKKYRATSAVERRTRTGQGPR